jgi:phosphoribosylglycinamide formyltransferase 1
VKKRTAILISGRGSNMRALIEAKQDSYEVVLVVSNRPDAEGLSIARALSIEVLAIDHKPFGKDREAFEREVDAALRARGIELVALAGFMRVLTPYFVRRWQGRLVNIHPSLLPKYPGTDTHARALAAGDAEHGCTAHLVTEEIDAGQILGQARMDVLPGDTSDTLAARVLALEHELYPRCLADWAREL